jgi:hypothetical protein
MPQLKIFNFIIFSFASLKSQPNTDSVRMPPPRSIPQRSPTKSLSSSTAPDTVVTKELRSRTISTSSEDLDHPKQGRARRLSSVSSTSSVSPPKNLRSPRKVVEDHPTTSKHTPLLPATKTKSPPKKKQHKP